MATLTGKKPAETYKDLLQVSNANSGIDATLRVVEDGEGTASPLYLASGKVKVEPSADATDVVEIVESDGTTVLFRIDTSNGRVVYPQLTASKIAKIGSNNELTSGDLTGAELPSVSSSSAGAVPSTSGASDGDVATVQADGSVAYETPASAALDQQAIYVSKAGNDSNDGLNVDEPKLTISAAISAADTAGYGLVQVLDAGEYSETITCVAGINVLAPAATLTVDGTNQLVPAGGEIDFYEIKRTTGGNAMILFSGATTRQKFRARVINNGGTGAAIRYSFTSIPIIDVDELYVGDGGTASGDAQGAGPIGIVGNTAAVHGHIRVRDIYCNQDGTTGIQSTNNSNTLIDAQHIVDLGYANTVGIDLQAGQCRISTRQIDCDVAYDVASGATLDLIANGITGTRTNAGTVNVLCLDGDSVLGGDLTAVGLTADTITIDGSELDPTGHTAGQVLQSDGTDFVPANLNLQTNVVINPNFAVVQRQATPGTLTTYNDGTYCADRWVLLTQDASGQFGRITGDTQRHAGQLKKTASGTTRLGAIQWVEGANCQHLRGQTVTLQLRVRCSESTKTIRCGIVESTKTEDSITRDAISDWTTTPVSLITDYSFAGTPGSVTSDTTWQTLSYTATLGSSFNNLGVLIWSETGLSQNATLDIEAVKLAPGQLTSFVPRLLPSELGLCQYYYYRETWGTTVAFELTFAAISSNSSKVIAVWRLPTSMRIEPSLVVSDATGFQVYYGSVADVTTMSLRRNSLNSIELEAGHNGSLTAGSAAFIRSDGTTGRWLAADAEL
jgi:hypothetical protein